MITEMMEVKPKAAKVMMYPTENTPEKVGEKN
jgi:hypothetical protein